MAAKTRPLSGPSTLPRSIYRAIALDQPAEVLKVVDRVGLAAVDDRGRNALIYALEEARGSRVVKALLRRGADPSQASPTSGDTPLHIACRQGTSESVEALLTAGAELETRNRAGLTPLAAAFSVPYNSTVLAVACMLRAGARFTKEAKTLARDCVTGRRWSEELRNVLKLHRVNLGKLPPVTDAPSWVAKHEELWKRLVPASGPARTHQGEVIRLSGRLMREVLDNGSVNWDADWDRMTKFLVETLCSKEVFTRSLQANIVDFAKDIVHQRRSLVPPRDKCYRLAELSVIWATAQAEPIPLARVAYKR